ncbi:MAG: M67 family metallopeptidase [Cyanobium sp.]
MLPFTPAGLAIDRQALTVLRRILAAAAPQEGCALLLGRRLGPLEEAPARGRLWRVERIWPALNVWEPVAERRHRFQLDPREQLLAQRWGRERGLEVLGAAHSHPEGAPAPSATDLRLTAGPTLMAILGPPAGGGSLLEGPLACWWLAENPDDPERPPEPPRPLMWRMVD